MSNLEKLYADRKTFEEYGSEIPPSLAAEIKEAENVIFEAINNKLAEVAPSELAVDELKGSIIVALEYENGKLVRVGTREASKDVFSILEMSELIIEDEDGPEDTPTPTGRKDSIPFSVTFPDGEVIYYKNAKRTMIETLQKLGLERVSHFRGEIFKGYQLVGKEQRKAPGGKWQEEVDGWWIYINMGNPRKIRALKKVAKMLGVPIRIELRED